MYTNATNENLLEFDLLKGESGVFAFTTTCVGGVSDGNYSSFNLGEYSGDRLENVSENRKRLARMVGVEFTDLILPYQSHEDKVVVIDTHFMALPAEDKRAFLHEVDALVTNLRNVCIGVGTADCVPLLFYDQQTQCVAVAHAGWRGTVANIGAKTLEQMIKAYGCKPQDIRVCIGASISPKYFEVGNEVFDLFVTSNFEMDKIAFRNTESGKWHINLWEANKLQLFSLGVLPQHIEVAELCTYSLPELFFSARRQGIKSGRIVTGAVLK